MASANSRSETKTIKNEDEAKQDTGQGAKSRAAAAPELTPEMRAQIDKMRDNVLARFAQVVMSFMGVPRYSHQSIKDLQSLAMVPLMRERIAIATVAPVKDGTDKAGAGGLTNPLVGMALWANVSGEVDTKIREQIAAGIFPIKLSAKDWDSGDIVWLLDVIAPSQKLSAQVLASFKQVLAAKLPDKKDAEVKLHPVIKKMIGDEMLEKIGARSAAAPAPKNKPQVKTRTVKPKGASAPKVKAKKRMVN